MKGILHIMMLWMSIILIFSINVSAFDVKEDLSTLDKVLSNSNNFEVILNNRIQRIELELETEYPADDIKKYDLYTALFEEYLPYQFDKALSALNEQEIIANHLRDKDYLTQTKLRKAMLYCIGGFYKDAEMMITGVDTLSFSQTSNLLWCDFRQRYCYDFLSKAAGRSTLAQYYRSKYIEISPEGSFDRDYMCLLRYMGEEDFNSALELGHKLIVLYPSNSHEYAKISFYMGMAYGRLGNLNEELHWYCQSAEADVSCAVKDNASLHSIAMNLISQKMEIERAFKYTQIAMDDALFYNSSLRLKQIVSTLPYIEDAYSAQRDKTEHTLSIFLSIVICLLLALGIFVIMFNYSNKRLKKAIEALKEASDAKEAFLGLFLSMSSSSLDKLKPFLTRSQMDAEFKNFYNSFDSAFVQLYPDFIEEFNSLLVPEARVTLKKGELLNTELRIFALIRLGVDKSSHIASLLRYSVNTIYNYRTQIRTAAINQKVPFEEQLNNPKFYK